MLTNESDYPDTVGGTAIATSGGVVMRPEYGRCKIRRYPLQPRKVLHPPRKFDNIIYSRNRPGSFTRILLSGYA
jgi:hypothetical protein